MSLLPSTPDTSLPMPEASPTLRTETQSAQPSEFRAICFWVAVILVFFGLQALLWTTALSLVQKYPLRPHAHAPMKVDGPVSRSPSASKSAAGRSQRDADATAAVPPAGSSKDKTSPQTGQVEAAEGSSKEARH